MQKSYFGAPIEVATEEQGAKLLKEVVPEASGSAAKWKEKPESEYKKYPIMNQHDTDQCVAFSLAKLLAITFFIDEGIFIEFSPSYFYEQRSSWPNPGMAAQDAYSIAKRGATPSVLYPPKIKNNNKEKLSAKQFAIDVASIFKLDNGLDLPLDMDSIAATIELTGKGVMAFSYSSYREWQREIPKKMDEVSLINAAVRHAWTIVDYFLIKESGKLKKAFLIEDSWGIKTGKDGRRIVTEDFFSRIYYAGYITKFVFSTSSDAVLKPKKALKFGDQDPEVNILQKYLQAKGFFPINHGTSNYYGSITAEAVLKWQLANKIDAESTLIELKGYHFGPKSIAAA